MKKQLSVFALHARAAIGRLALVLLGMLALDAAAYALFGLRGFRASLTGSELVTALRVIFSLGLVACQLLLASCFLLPRLREQAQRVFLRDARAAGTATRCGGCRSRRRGYCSGAACAMRSALRACGACN